MEFNSVDLTDKENLDVEKVTLELTHKNNLYDMRSPVKNEEIIDEDGDHSYELSAEKWMEVLEMLHENGVKSVTLTGGEPTIRDDFHDILGFATSLFDSVTVQTHGNTKTKLSGYNCTVAIYLEDFRPMYHNSIFRMTDPERYSLDLEQGILTDEKGGVCKYCGKQVENVNGARMHIKGSHVQDVINEFNASFDTYEELKQIVKDSDEIGWMDFYDTEYEAGKLEGAFQRALQKAERIDNDVVLRTTIYGNNNVEGVMTEAERRGLNTVFVPLKPVGKAGENFKDQVPDPSRMQEVCGKVYSIDGLLGTNHTVNSPLYTAAELKEARTNLSREDVEADYLIQDELEKYWNRGRVTDIGVNRFNVLPDGTVTVSRFLRGEKHELGNILSNSWGRLKENLAEWNNKVQSEEFKKPAKGFDLRRKSVASDLEVLLNYNYREQQIV